MEHKREVDHASSGACVAIADSRRTAVDTKEMGFFP